MSHFCKLVTTSNDTRSFSGASTSASAQVGGLPLLLLLLLPWQHQQQQTNPQPLAVVLLLTTSTLAVQLQKIPPTTDPPHTPPQWLQSLGVCLALPSRCKGALITTVLPDTPRNNTTNREGR